MQTFYSSARKKYISDDLIVVNVEQCFYSKERKPSGGGVYTFEWLWAVKPPHEYSVAVSASDFTWWLSRTKCLLDIVKLSFTRPEFITANLHSLIYLIRQFHKGFGPPPTEEEITARTLYERVKAATLVPQHCDHWCYLDFSVTLSSNSNIYTIKKYTMTAEIKVRPGCHYLWPLNRFAFAAYILLLKYNFY